MLMELKERTIGIIGAKRSGKTYLTAKIVNKLVKQGERVVVFDTIGELGKQIDKARIYHIEPDNRVGGDMLYQQAVSFGILMKQYKGKLPIGVNLIDLTRDEIVDFTDVVLTTVGKIENRYFIFDEVAEYLNQFYRQSRELERLIRHGGNWKNTFIFNSQRPAYINKNTFNLIDILIVFRLNWSRDIAVLKDLLSNTGLTDKEVKKEIEIITHQRVGEFRAYQLYLS